MNQNESEGDNNIFDFIKEIFIGIETKIFSHKDSKLDFTENIKTKQGMLVGMNFLELYLNELHRNLVQKDDDFILKKFEQLSQPYNMKPTLILNLITNIIMKCYPLFPRSKLNIEDEGKYIESVSENVEKMRKYTLQIIKGDLEMLLSQTKAEVEEN